jgi:hypothetical protein
MRTVALLAVLAASLMQATAAAEPTAADKATARRISTYLQKSGQLRNYRIGITYQDGVATLSGNVADSEQRDKAVRLAQQVDGVTQIDCQLECAETVNSGADEGNRIGLSNAFEKVTPVAAGREPSNIVQASGQNALPETNPVQRAAMPARNQIMSRPRQMPRSNMPVPSRRFGIDPAVRQASTHGVYPAGGPNFGPGAGAMMAPGMGGGGMGGPQAVPAGYVPTGSARGPSYENAQMPGYSWPSYASYPNYAALSYPQQYSPTAWPYIGPFYPYPQVPLAWRKVALEWDDGWWFLDFSAHNSSH